MSVELIIKADYNAALQTVKNALRNVKNIKPVWRRFAKEYSVLIQKNWDTRGLVMQRTKWAKLSPAYLLWKQKNFPGKRKLVRTGEMQERALNVRAVAKRRKLILEWSMPEYWKYHQQPDVSGPNTGGTIPKRAFLWHEDNTLPKRALRILIDLLRDHMKKGVR